MGEKSEVQNLTEPTGGDRAADAGPRAEDADQVQQGEPKDYPRDVLDADEPYAGEGAPAR